MELTQSQAGGLRTTYIPPSGKCLEQTWGQVMEYTGNKITPHICRSKSLAKANQLCTAQPPFQGFLWGYLLHYDPGPESQYTSWYTLIAHRRYQTALEHWATRKRLEAVIKPQHTLIVSIRMFSTAAVLSCTCRADGGHMHSCCTSCSAREGISCM